MAVELLDANNGTLINGTVDGGLDITMVDTTGMITSTPHRTAGVDNNGKNLGPVCSKLSRASIANILQLTGEMMPSDLMQHVIHTAMIHATSEPTIAGVAADKKVKTHGKREIPPTDRETRGAKAKKIKQ
jgi:hypothetical protein